MNTEASLDVKGLCLLKVKSFIDKDALPTTALRILLVSGISKLSRQEVVIVPFLSVHVYIAFSGLDCVCH